jgi:hypothetical protein
MAEPEEIDVPVDPKAQPKDIDVSDVKDISEIQSWDDVKEIASDGVDKLMNSSSDEIKEEALRIGNKALKWWQRVVGDKE